MKRFQSILVPIDFSPSTDAVTALAIELAREGGATLHLFHAYEIPLGAIPPYGVAIPEGVFEAVRDAAARQLARAARRLEEAGAKVQTHLVHAASPSQGIIDAAREVAADIVVMGTHGWTGVKHALLGSVAERTARLAPCPVLTVRAPGTEAQDAAKAARFRKILVPVDFSPHSDAALDVAIELAKEHGGTIHLLHAYSLPVAATMAYGVAIPPTVWEGVQQAANEKLAENLARVTAAGVKCETHLETEPAADVIATAAAHWKSDLIVIGTRGLTGVKHVLLGSVAERVLRTAPCAVLTVKKAEADA